MEAIIGFVIFVALVGWFMNRDTKPLDEPTKKLLDEVLKDKPENKPQQKKWPWVVAVMCVVAFVVFAYWQQKRSAQDYQNAIDYTTCRSDMRKGLSTAAECEQVRSDDWVYIKK